MYYHLHCNLISKSNNQSCKELSNYQSAYGKKWEHKQQEVVSDHMLFADRVPVDFRDRLAFWDAVEQRETGQMARAFDVAIPNEFDDRQADETARAMAEQFMRDGLPAVQYSVHFIDNNKHIHFLIPCRNIDEDGKWSIKQKKIYSMDENGRKIPVLDSSKIQAYFEETGVRVDQAYLEHIKDENQWKNIVEQVQKTRSGNRKEWKRETVEENTWDSKEWLLKWRKDWEVVLNDKMQEIGLNDRVDCRSYEAQGIELTPMVHIGKTAHIEERLERKTLNEEIKQDNNEIIKSQMFINEYPNVLAKWKNWVQNLIDFVLKPQILIQQQEQEQHRSHSRGRGR